MQTILATGCMRPQRERMKSTCPTWHDTSSAPALDLSSCSCLALALLLELPPLPPPLKVVWILCEYCVNFLQARVILSRFWHGFGVRISDRKFDAWISREFRMNFVRISREFWMNFLKIIKITTYWIIAEILHGKKQFTRNSHPRLHPRKIRNSHKIHTHIFTHAIRAQIDTQFAPTRTPKANQDFEIILLWRFDTGQKFPNLI